MKATMQVQNNVYLSLMLLQGEKNECGDAGFMRKWMKW